MYIIINMPVITKNVKLPKKCPINGCRQQLDLANNFLCSKCNGHFCLHHRFDFSHDCKKEETDHTKWNNYVKNYKAFTKASQALLKEKEKEKN